MNTDNNSPVMPGASTSTKTATGGYLMQFFSYSHLSAPMQAVSRPFCELAEKLSAELPENPEKTTALRKLLEAKDCAVRAWIFKSGTA
jgi:hypothetical protein